MVPERITDFLISKGVIDVTERDIYIYGFDSILYLYLSTIGLFAFGLILGKELYSILMILGFYALQSKGGGYHAETHFRCFIMMAMGLISGTFFEVIREKNILLFAILFFSVCILAMIPVVLHPNKIYLDGCLAELVGKSYWTLFIVIIIGGFLFVALKLPLWIICSVFFYSALSRVAGKLKYCLLDTNL